MENWAVNTEAFDAATLTIRLEQSRPPSIKEFDNVILFDRKRDEVFFLSFATVASVKVEEVLENTFVFLAVLTIPQPFEEPRGLSVFSFSLAKVNRYSNPAVHFGRKYVSLTNNDFRTLINSHVFWARTAFGTYLNSLPAIAVASFVQMISIEAPELIVLGTTFETLWQYLRRFIDGEYLGAHALAQAIATDAQKLSVTVKGLDFEKLRLDDGKGQLSFSLAQQQRRLATFAESLHDTVAGPNLLDQLDSRIQENQTIENNFERLFQGTRWPTQLIKA